MSKFDPPDLPSEEDLGLTKEEIEALEKELGDDDGPEMTPEELEAFLGGSSPPPEPIAIPKPKKLEDMAKSIGAGGAAGEPAADAPDPAADKKAAKEAAKEAKRAAKERAKAEKAAEKAAKKAQKAAGGPVKEEADSATEKAERPKLEEAPRTGWRGVATLLLLLAAAVASSTRTGLPRPAPASAPDDAFSSARAMTMLVDIAREAHPPGSPAHAGVIEYLVERLADLGLEPEVQTTTSVFQNNTFARTATVRNVVARVPGTASTGSIVLTAHYDSREIARGAGDDGSGVVSILEAVRALQAGEPVRNDLILLLTDAEELGLLGARAFVDEHPWMDDVRLVLSFEMRGGGGPAVMFETNEENGWVVRALQAAHPDAEANSMSYEVYKALPNDTDFTPFREAGVQGLNFAAIDNAHIYHQRYDAPDNLSESTLQHQGLNALRTIRHLGNADLSIVNAPNVVYLTLPFVGLVVYDAGFVIPITVGLGLLLVLAFALVQRGGWGIPGTLVGLGVSIVGGTLAYFGAEALMGWLPRFHPEMGSLHGGAFHSEGWYVLAIAAGAFTIVTGLHAVVRRWWRIQDLALGAAVVPLVGAAGLTFTYPMAAMNLQWPVAAALLATIALSLLGKREDGAVGWLLAVVAAAFSLSVLVPLTEFLWIALSLRVAGILGVLIALTLYLCLASLDGLRHPNSWWAPVGGLVVTGATLGIGLLAANADDEGPAPSTLVYAYDHGTAAGLWVTDPLTDSVDLPARQWAVQAAGSTFEREADLSDFGYRSGDVPVTDGPSVTAEPPIVRLETDESLEDGRRVVISIRSRIGAERLVFRYPEGGRTRILSINGKELIPNRTFVFADHWGDPAPAVFLELSVPEGAPVELDIVEHHFRPAELVGAEPFARPPDLAPDITRLSDRAMLRYSLNAETTPIAGEAGLFEMPVPVEGAEAVDAGDETAGGSPATDSTGGSADATATPRDTLATPVDTIGR